MQLKLNLSLTGTWVMEVLRSLSILNPEEMDDTELLKDLRSLGKPPSLDGEDTMLVNTAVDTRETFILESSGQEYRKEILPLESTSPRSPSWSESERTPESHQRNGQSGEPAHRDAADSVH